MRCIDADALSDWMKDYGQKCIKGERKISLMYIWKHIQDAPTIERKTEKWIPMFDGKFHGGAYWFQCSKCSRVVPDVRNGGWNFCPKCGAKMDGGEQE